MIHKFLLGVLLTVLLAVFANAQDKPIRLGIIGTDTSHVPAFTQMLNDPSRPDHVPGARVVAVSRREAPAELEHGIACNTAAICSATSA